jgi:hypothetical protein
MTPPQRLPNVCVLLFIHSITHSLVPQLDLRQFLSLARASSHKVRSSMSSFSFQYRFVLLRLSSSCLRLFPRLHVSSILFSIFPSITCFRRQAPTQDATNPISLPLLRYVGYSYSLTSHTIDLNYLLHPSSAPHLKTCQVLLLYFATPCKNISVYFCYSVIEETDSSDYISKYSHFRYLISI